MKKRGFLSILLSLVLVLGLLPGMRLTAYAEGKTDISTSTAGAAYEGTKDSEDFTNEAAPLLTHTHDDSGETITFLPWDDAAAE